MEEVKKKKGTWGGKRPGQGRPKSGRAHKTYWVSPEEDEHIMKYLEDNKKAEQK